MSTIAVTDDTFEAEVLRSEGLVLVDFWAQWCGPCKQLGPVLEELSGEISGVKIVKMDIDANPEAPTKYGVRSIPTMILVKNGEVVSTKMGNQPKAELEAWISQNS